MAQSQSKTLTTMTTTFLVAGEDADMVIGFQSGEMFLALQRELPIGSPISVAYWLNEQYDAQGDGIELLCPKASYKNLAAFQDAYKKFKAESAGKDADAIKDLDLYKNVLAHLQGPPPKIPAAAVHIMISAILAEVVITDLIFQRKDEGAGANKTTTTKAKLGLAINFTAPLVLLPSLAVRKIALLIMYASNGDLSFPVRDTTTLPSPEPVSIPAHGWIDFKDHAPVLDDTIELNGVSWKFVAEAGIDQANKTTGIADGKDTALSQLVKGLNESPDPTISQCKYKLDGTKLMITAQAGGAERNKFTLGAQWAGVTEASMSGATLTGGVGELKENVPVPA
jgi:hypothetical protein